MHCRYRSLTFPRIGVFEVSVVGLVIGEVALIGLQDTPPCRHFGEIEMSRHSKVKPLLPPIGSNHLGEEIAVLKTRWMGIALHIENGLPLGIPTEEDVGKVVLLPQNGSPLTWEGILFSLKGGDFLNLLRRYAPTPSPLWDGGLD